jgi:hypothetical protein
VLGYGWFFVDALMVMLLSVIYLLLTHRPPNWADPKSLEAVPSIRDSKFGENKS